MSTPTLSFKTPEHIQDLLDRLNREWPARDTAAKLGAVNEVCRALWERGNKDFTARALKRGGLLPISSASLLLYPYVSLVRAWAAHAGAYAVQSERVLPTLSKDMNEDEVLKLLTEYVAPRKISLRNLVLLNDVCRARHVAGNKDFRTSSLMNEALKPLGITRCSSAGPAGERLIEWWAERAGEGALLTSDSVPSRFVPFPDVSSMPPDEALENLLAYTRRTRSRASNWEQHSVRMNVLDTVCREQSELGRKDFSLATIGTVSEQRGGPSYHVIRRGPSGAVYRALIESWARHSAGWVKQPNDENEHPDEVLTRALALPRYPRSTMSRDERNETLQALHAVCGEMAARGERDFRPSVVLSALTERATKAGTTNPLTRVLLGPKSGGGFRALLAAWARHAGGSTTQPRSQADLQSSPRRTGRGAKVADQNFDAWLEEEPTIGLWRDMALRYYRTRTRNLDATRMALELFVLDFVPQNDLARDPTDFLRKEYGPNVPDLMQYLEDANANTYATNAAKNNTVSDFLDWALAEVENGPTGHRYGNPIKRVVGRGAAYGESVRSSLPFDLLQRLRGFVNGGQTFRDWAWAQAALDSDWFEVERSEIDETDPDCVWRERRTAHGDRLEIWCPARAVALFIKLLLPLRTYQVRMLDSGEADTWRFDLTKRSEDAEHHVTWSLNDSHLRQGSNGRPHARGVFHRMSGSPQNAFLYINSNKTADIDKDENEKGYVIPWEHPDVLHWLAKLRDWQTRYNPLQAPTPWTELQLRDLGRTVTQATLAQRETTCFLFRNRARKLPQRRVVPVGDGEVRKLYWLALARLERECEQNGETDAAGATLRFVKDIEGGGVAMYYPLHSLRVTLISLMYTAGNVPLDMLVKVAGHSAMRMTLYYIKFDPLEMNEILISAEPAMTARQQEDHAKWLASLPHHPDSLGARFANLNEYTKNALLNETTNSLIWLDEGICVAAQSRCHEGAFPTLESKKAGFSPVPGFPEKNCVQCRFFVTGPAWLPGLQARLNLTSNQLSDLSKEYARLGAVSQVMERERRACHVAGESYPREKEYRRIQDQRGRAIEKFQPLQEKVDAVMALVASSFAAAREATDDNSIVLISHDNAPITEARLVLDETNLLQLQILCWNSELFKDMRAPESVIWERSQAHDAMLDINEMPYRLLGFTADEQLLIGNHLTRLLMRRTGNLHDTLPYLEGRRKLHELGVLGEVREFLDGLSMGGIQLARLTAEGESVRALPLAIEGKLGI